MRYAQRSIALILVLSLLACGGGNFAAQLRGVLAVSAPLIDSLVASGAIKPELRDTYIRDFTDLADGAASLKENLDGCADKSCKLGAVDIFQQAFWDIQRRGHFGSAPQLRNIEAIIKTIIAVAQAYYAPPTTGCDVRPTDKALEQDLKLKIRQLKRAMEAK